MKKIAKVVSVLFCSITVIMLGGYFNTASAIEPPATEWEKTFGGPGYDVGKSVQQTTDGGFIIAGQIKNGEDINAPHGADVYLIKTDADGKKLWDKTFGGSRNDKGISVQQTTDGGFIIAGETYSFGAKFRRIFNKD